MKAWGRISSLGWEIVHCALSTHQHHQQQQDVQHPQASSAPIHALKKEHPCISNALAHALDSQHHCASNAPMHAWKAAAPASLDSCSTRAFTACMHGLKVL
eukprot:358352-Chlamydomonas_euryale.AAC.6